MESEGFWAALGSVVGGLFGGGGGKKQSKANATQIQQLTTQLNLVKAENEKQSAMIKWIFIGLGILAVVIVFIFFIRSKRKK